VIKGEGREISHVRFALAELDAILAILANQLSPTGPFIWQEDGRFKALMLDTDRRYSPTKKSFTPFLTMVDVGAFPARRSQCRVKSSGLAAPASG
jgi:hypothetical protein